MRKGRHGFTCWGCRGHLATPYSNPLLAERYASGRGWCIGHSGGQGQIVCGDCTGHVWDPCPLSVGSAREVGIRARSYAKRIRSLRAVGHPFPGRVGRRPSKARRRAGHKPKAA